MAFFPTPSCPPFLSQAPRYPLVETRVGFRPAKLEATPPSLPGVPRLLPHPFHLGSPGSAPEHQRATLPCLKTAPRLLHATPGLSYTALFAVTF